MLEPPYAIQRGRWLLRTFNLVVVLIATSAIVLLGTQFRSWDPIWAGLAAQMLLGLAALVAIFGCIMPVQFYYKSTRVRHIPLAIVRYTDALSQTEVTKNDAMALDDFRGRIWRNVRPTLTLAAAHLLLLGTLLAAWPLGYYS